MPPGSSNQDYMYILERLLEPVADDFGADFYFLEVGFDAHKDDPLSRIMLDDEFYPWITSKMREIAGKMVLIFEGGYDLAALSRCNMKMINVLRDELNVDVGRNLQRSHQGKKCFRRNKENISQYPRCFFIIL